VGQRVGDELRLLVTGSRGFIGGSLGRFFAVLGHDVLGLGRASQPSPGWLGEYVQADVAHADIAGLVREFVPEVVLHAAGPASVGASFAEPLEDLRASLLTSANTLECVRRSGTRPLVVFFSSAAVYGEPGHLPVDEAQPIAPISPYGFHKAGCELLAREYAECFEQEILVCRLFSVFGAEQRRLLVWELYQQLRGPGDAAWLEGSGRESRDYLGIEDVGGALDGLLRRRDALARDGCAIVNVASGEETSIAGLAQHVRDLLASEKALRWRGLRRPGDPERWCADTTRLRALVPDWRPRPLPLALQECLRAWEDRRDSVTIGA
jgi:UDP-glucose 4-epimerase